MIDAKFLKVKKFEKHDVFIARIDMQNHAFTLVMDLMSGQTYLIDPSYHESQFY